MFLRSFALINSVDHLDARPSGKQAARRAAPTSAASSSPSAWSQAAVAAELASLTRLFKRLMRSRSRSTARLPSDPVAQWQSTVAAVRHAAPAETQHRAAPASPRIHGSDRVPAMLRKAQTVRRLSPVQVGSFASAAVAQAHPHHPRVLADPVDPKRVVISGSFAEVCATLDRLVDKQETALAQR